MEATETGPALTPLVELGPDDAAGGFALSEEAGWNQSFADWVSLIRLGRAFGAYGHDGRLVASSLAVAYPSGFGWIGMVIVHGPHRRRGLATRLMDRSIAELRRRDLVPLLDATPAGRPVYERIGFRPVEALTRWRGPGGGRSEPGLPPVSNVAAIGALDRAAFGTDRSAVLADLLQRPGALSRHEPGGDGFALARPGRTATYLGPVVAADGATALRLFASALAGIAGPVVIDVPDRQSEVSARLAGLGFQAERPLTRMALERETPFGDPSLVFAIAAPELG